ncbi:putative serine/threonine-protein kinase ndrA [Psilocybe cubensis]|uniref:Serine/threonine-protein kinase ndrA n=1 Tax=Psilocybe cubensis TaxID=181762 RepID=A0ACB8GX95_PSICU|nr:putative serine/threonine-protein kinase ndrA [Psilocybe cubensis]KAH9480261.1 putative serine/threonine-protein kinase ndrA [Psilocybe cubensis]
MFSGNVLAGDVSFPAHYIFSKLACNGSTPPQRDYSNSLASLKSLAHWALQVASSTKPLLLSSHSDVQQATRKQASSLIKHVSTTPAVFVIYTSITGENPCVGVSPAKQKISLLALYTLDKLGNFQLLGSLYLSTSYQAFENSRRVSYESSNEIKAFPLPRQNLECIFYFLPTSFFSTTLKLGRQTFLGFIKNGYSGPRRLRSCRKVVLDLDGYQITHIGKGAFAIISRVIHRASGEIRVMKRITFDNTGLAEYLARNEVDALKAMSGNVWFPPLLNNFEEGGEFLITMPFYHRGDLAALIEHKGYLGRKLAQFYSAQLILAIHNLHKMGIIHRDIKTDNIFLDGNGHLVLADLGLAENIATYEGGEEMMKYFPEWLEARDKGGDDFPLLWVNHRNPLSMIGSAGTFWYTAPEVFRKERYSFGVDYWSVGVIYYELITGHIPFNHFKPYPENKRPELDFTMKPGQLKDVVHWEEEALSEVRTYYNELNL